MRATQATSKVGILFENWRDGHDQYFHSFGLTGKDHWSTGFQHFWLHGLTKGHEQSYDDCCRELKAADGGRFAHLPDEAMSYAYQLDATRYAQLLRQLPRSTASGGSKAGSLRSISRAGPATSPACSSRARAGDG